MFWTRQTSALIEALDFLGMWDTKRGLPRPGLQVARWWFGEHLLIVTDIIVLKDMDQ
jgi:hypothetical protein